MESTVILVPTKGRPHHLQRCLRSIEECTPNPRIVVIDQDPDAGAERLCQGFAGLALDYLHHPAGGKSAALNAGIRASGSTFIAFTDDDCTVPGDWIGAGTRAFAGAPRLAIVSGGAVACPHDPRREFVPAHIPGSREVRRGGRAVARIGALGGNMFARRDALERLGGFDEALGPGCHFPSGEDQDLNNRALRAGYDVLCDPSILVTHWGGRAYGDEATRLLRGYSRGIGALAAKDVRLGSVTGVYPLIRELSVELRFAAAAVVRPAAAPFVFRSPWLIQGLWQGMRAPLDRRAALFGPERAT